MAGTERKRRQVPVRVVALVLAGGLVLAAGGVTYALVSGGSAAPVVVVAHSSPLAGLKGHPLLAPECDPITGRRWSYPVGPPVRGLPGIVANIKSNLYEVFAIKYSCKQADAWIRKLSQLRIPIRHNGNVTVLKGPPGYYCSAYPDANGFAYAGGCQSGGGGGCVVTKIAAGRPYANGRGCKLTGGKQAFGWNWNVANRRVVFAHDAGGVLHLIHVSGADTSVMFHYLSNSYELQVMNTSGIGYLDGFTWVPSEGWKVTRIESSSGAKCTLSPGGAGKISCTGSVKPPSCLCTGDGGIVSIKFTAVPTKKNAGYLFAGAPWQFKVTKMTPVPYLVPGTPDEALKREGV